MNTKPTPPLQSSEWLDRELTKLVIVLERGIVAVIEHNLTKSALETTVQEHTEKAKQAILQKLQEAEVEAYRKGYEHCLIGKAPEYKGGAPVRYRLNSSRPQTKGGDDD